MLSRGKEFGEPRTRLGAQFGAAETDGVETQRQRAVADQGLRVSGVEVAVLGQVAYTSLTAIEIPGGSSRIDPRLTTRETISSPERQ